MCMHATLLQSCLILFDPMDCSPPGSCLQDLLGKSTAVGCHARWDSPDPGIKPMSLTSPALAGGFFTNSTTWEAQ